MRERFEYKVVGCGWGIYGLGWLWESFFRIVGCFDEIF